MFKQSLGRFRDAKVMMENSNKPEIHILEKALPN
jgi:hypothetical protein